MLRIRTRGESPEEREGETARIKDLGNAHQATQEEKARRGLITAAWFNDYVTSVKDFAVAVGKERPTYDLGLSALTSIGCNGVTGLEGVQGQEQGS